MTNGYKHYIAVVIYDHLCQLSEPCGPDDSDQFII